MSRATKLFEWEQHKTPKGVAEFMRAQGALVGHQYKTHGEIWDVDEKILQTGLLHLILDQLQKTPVEKDADIERHTEWLVKQQPGVAKLIRTHEKECKRIARFCGLELLGRDVRAIDPNRYAMAYRRSWSDHYTKKTRLKEKVDRLKKVKSLDDLAELAGIGPVYALRIKAKMQESK